jgi:hypothetical protein
VCVHPLLRLFGRKFLRRRVKRREETYQARSARQKRGAFTQRDSRELRFEPLERRRFALDHNPTLTVVSHKSVRSLEGRPGAAPPAPRLRSIRQSLTVTETASRKWVREVSQVAPKPKAIQSGVVGDTVTLRVRL